MRKQLVCLAVLATLIQVMNYQKSYAYEPVVVSRKVQRFINSDCFKTDSCDLLQFTVASEDYTIDTHGQPNYASRMYAEYETDKIENLHRYVIVQFLKGCRFETMLDKDGKILKLPIKLVLSFEEYYPFRFPDWIIDSVDKDPAYFSSPGASSKDRISKYLWSGIQWPTNRVEIYKYGLAEPVIPRLFVTDRFHPTFKGNNLTENISLQFRTCIYKSADVPREANRNNTEFAVPLACLPWSSSYIYNYDTGNFDSPAEIDPFCLEPRDVKIFK